MLTDRIEAVIKVFENPDKDGLPFGAMCTFKVKKVRYEICLEHNYESPEEARRAAMEQLRDRSSRLSCLIEELLSAANGWKIKGRSAVMEVL